MGRRYVERACALCATSQVHVVKHIYKPLETESACVVSTEKKSIRCSGEKNQCNYFTEDCVKKQILISRQGARTKMFSLIQRPTYSLGLRVEHTEAM